MDTRLKGLTKEELEILDLACDGKSSEEIAAVLGMTHGAFQKNAQMINRKLGIENLLEADRKREIHRLCAAVADLQSGRGRSVIRRDPDSRKGIVAVADLLSGRDSSVVRTHDPMVEIYNQSSEKVAIIDVTPW
jgi:DNA-binding CsgD family transcriptional regulator